MCMLIHVTHPLLAGSNRSGATALMTISMDGKVLPTVIIKTGKTEKCLQGMSIHVSGYKMSCVVCMHECIPTCSCYPGAFSAPHLITTYSDNGWNTQSIMMQYLHTVIIPYTNNQPCILTLDCYSCHLTASVLRFAFTHNIHFVTVPAGTTSTLQPLDVKVFGAVKYKWRSAWEKSQEGSDDDSPLQSTHSSTFNHAISLLSPILQHLRSWHIRSAFKTAWTPLFNNTTEYDPDQPDIDMERKYDEKDDKTVTDTSTSLSTPHNTDIPYHWIDPEYKPKQHFIRNPCTDLPKPAPVHRKRSSNKKPSSQPSLPPPLPPPTFCSGLVCSRCSSLQQYFRRCACMPIPFCVSCLPISWICPICCYQTNLL